MKENQLNQFTNTLYFKADCVAVGHEIHDVF
jgi:hypothetical protein